MIVVAAIAIFNKIEGIEGNKKKNLNDSEKCIKTPSLMPGKLVDKAYTQRGSHC